ncbi:hypothetical protein JW752_01140 [Candidatus Peregrinibacteria bacterium]|nr:hypothetical protein [Candidatus Peregrinibacteria bacterium]
MFKKLLILFMAAFLLTGCFDTSNRFPEPADEIPVEDTEEENVTDEEVVDEEAVDDEEMDEEEDMPEEEMDEEEDEAPAEGEGTSDEDDEEAVEETDDNDVFVQAFLNKYPDWEEKLDTLELTVNSNDGSFASGGVSFAEEIGGAAWFAANTDDGWVIAWDGNGTIGCAEIEPYDFPLEMIPECWDDENQVMVDRGAENGEAE